MVAGSVDAIEAATPKEGIRNIMSNTKSTGKAANKPLVARKNPEATGTTDANAKATDGATATATEPKKAKEPKAPKAPKEPKAKPVRETPAHMKKVQRFEAGLPQLDSDTKAILESAKGLSTGQLNILAAWIGLEARKRATEAAAGVKLNLGDTVKIVSGRDTRFIGKVGKVSEVMRIRCKVSVEGIEKPAYLFAADVEILERAPQTKTIDTNDDAASTTSTGTNG